MAEKFIYYGIVGESNSPAEPGGVLRRSHQDGLQIDEVFSRKLTWVPSPLLLEAEHGDTMLDFTEISEEDANQIVERIRANAPYE
jgi:hypothetical protein